VLSDLEENKNILLLLGVLELSRKVIGTYIGEICFNRAHSGDVKTLEMILKNPPKDPKDKSPWEMQRYRLINFLRVYSQEHGILSGEPEASIVHDILEGCWNCIMSNLRGTTSWGPAYTRTKNHAQALMYLNGLPPKSSEALENYLENCPIVKAKQ